MQLNDLKTYIDNIYYQLKYDDYKSYDPFDSLNSHLFNSTPLKYSRWCRLAWLQFHKRSFINLRPLVLIPKKRNSKGVALVVLGLLRLAKYRPDVLNEAIELGEWLLTQRCDGWSGAAWGYPFAWQARAFYVSFGKPNLIATAYVARALRALGEQTNRQDFVDVANQAGEFVIHHLINKSVHGTYFSYIPGEQPLVHNANLWASVILAQAAKSLQKESWLDEALQAVQLTVNAQRADGAWVYGGRHHHQFVDGFHSGYNLESLSILQDLLDDKRYQPMIDAGLAFYLKHCFHENGAPMYYADQPYPIDTHSVAQALVTFEKLNVPVSYSKKVIQYACRYLYEPRRHYFYYQLTKLGINKVCYGRWVQSWMFYGMCTFYNCLYKSIKRQQSEVDDEALTA